ncbi:hypothetical protein JHK82_018007 [Glycine max]|nr:hypothetical protein JHK82_018007 [Glycine max]
MGEQRCFKNRLPKEAVDFLSSPHPYSLCCHSCLPLMLNPLSSSKSPLSNVLALALIPSLKGEFQWMFEFRLKAFDKFQSMKEPTWFDNTYPPPPPSIEFQNICYYSKSKNKPLLQSLDDANLELPRYFDKLSIPLNEQKSLANVIIDVVLNSVFIATTHCKTLEKVDIIFCSIFEAIKNLLKEQNEESGLVKRSIASRVFEVSLVDLQGDEDHAFKKIRLRAEDVQGKNVLTNLWIHRKMREIMTNQTTSYDLKELVRKFILQIIRKEIEKATSSIYPQQNISRKGGKQPGRNLLQAVNEYFEMKARM